MYNLIISKEGRFYFEVKRTNCVTENDLREFVTELRALYPETSGYKIDAYKRVSYSESVDV